MRRPRPRTAIVSEAATRKIHARIRREARDRELTDALKRWNAVPAHVAEAQRYVITEDSDDVEMIR